MTREDRRTRSRGRTFLATLVTILASVAILATLLAHYANVLSNSSAFSTQAVKVVHTGAVDSLIVDTVTNRVLSDFGGGVGSVQPLVRSAVRAAVSSGQVTAEMQRAAGTLETQLVSGHATALTLTLPDLGAALASAVQSRSTQLAELVSHVGTISVFDVPIPSSAESTIHALATVGRDSSLLIVLTAALIALALLLSEARRGTLLGLGVGALISGLIAAAIYLIGRGIVVGEFSSSAARTAARAAWNVYLGGLETSGLVVAAIGAVVAVFALLSRPRHPRGLAAR